MNLRKWIYLALFLAFFYYIFIVNIFVTISVIFGIYLIFKLFKLYSKMKLNKLVDSKELFAQSELGLFIALVAKVAKADGRVHKIEAQLISNMFDDICKVFNDKEKARNIMKEIFNESKQNLDNTEQIAQDLNLRLGKSILKRRQYISFLIQLSFVDNGISEEENIILRKIANALNINSQILETILNNFENMGKNKPKSMNVNDAYKVLGVKESDDMNTIKKQYRKLVREYHPDIINSQNKSEAYIEEATAKTQEINQAYNVIKELRK